MLIKLVERPDEPPFVRHVAIVQGAGGEREFSAGSPDEALGYAIRELLLERGVEMKNGDRLLVDSLRVSMSTREVPSGGDV